MKIKDLDPIITCELRITFDEDPNTGDVDIIVPVSTEVLTDILGEKLLNTEIHLLTVKNNALVVSTNER